MASVLRGAALAAVAVVSSVVSAATAAGAVPSSAFFPVTPTPPVAAATVSVWSPVVIAVVITVSAVGRAEAVPCRSAADSRGAILDAQLPVVGEYAWPLRVAIRRPKRRVILGDIQV